MHDRITPTDLRQWGACYPDARILKLWSGREHLTCREVTALDVPHADKMWVLTHALWRRDPWLCYDAAAYAADAAAYAADAAADAAAYAAAYAADAAADAADADAQIERALALIEAP